MIPNFHKVTDFVYRGGQPDQQGWQSLKDMGIKRVIKLDTRCENPDDNLDFEVLDYSMDWLEQILGPTVVKVENATKAIGATPTFVHCLHGQDRTGLVVACWRVWVMGWTKAEAQAEMLDLGFHKWLVGLWWFWRQKV